MIVFFINSLSSIVIDLDSPFFCMFKFNMVIVIYIFLSVCFIHLPPFERRKLGVYLIQHEFIGHSLSIKVLYVTMSLTTTITTIQTLIRHLILYWLNHNVLVEYIKHQIYIYLDKYDFSHTSLTDSLSLAYIFLHVTHMLWKDANGCIVKLSLDGSPNRYKSQLVSLENKQEYGIDYDQKFAPVT